MHDRYRSFRFILFHDYRIISDAAQNVIGLKASQYICIIRFRRGSCIQLYSGIDGNRAYHQWRDILTGTLAILHNIVNNVNARRQPRYDHDHGVPTGGSTDRW